MEALPRQGRRIAASASASTRALAWALPVLQLLLLAPLLGSGMAQAAMGPACTPGVQFVYLDNKDYLLAKCGSNTAIAQLLQCTASMVVTLTQDDGAGLSPGLCALAYAPDASAAVGSLRALPRFPCGAVFGYTGVGADAESAGSLVLQVNTTALCAWVAANNQTSPAANEFGGFCIPSPSLTLQQRHAAVFGRCLAPPRFKLDAPPTVPGAEGDGGMARTIGLAVGIVLLAGLLGAGVAVYVVRRIKRAAAAPGPGEWPAGAGPGGSGSGSGPIVHSRHGLTALPTSGDGSGPHVAAVGTAYRSGSGGDGFPSQRSGAANPAYRGGPSSAAAGAASAVRVVSGGGGARYAPGHPRQPPLVAQLQDQRQRQAQAWQGQGHQQQQQGQQPGRGQAQGQQVGQQQQQQQLLQQQQHGQAQRVHHWRPGALPRPPARESPFASLLEEDEGSPRHVPGAQLKQGQAAGQQGTLMQHQPSPAQPPRLI